MMKFSLAILLPAFAAVSSASNIRGKPDGNLQDLIDTSCPQFNCTKVDSSSLECNLDKPKNGAFHFGSDTRPSLSELTEAEKEDLKSELEAKKEERLQKLLSCVCCEKLSLDEVFAEEDTSRGFGGGSSRPSKGGNNMFGGSSSNGLSSSRPAVDSEGGGNFEQGQGNFKPCMSQAGGMRPQGNAGGGRPGSGQASGRPQGLGSGSSESQGQGGFMPGSGGETGSGRPQGSGMNGGQGGSSSFSSGTSGGRPGMGGSRPGMSGCGSRPGGSGTSNGEKPQGTTGGRPGMGGAGSQAQGSDIPQGNGQPGQDNSGEGLNGDEYDRIDTSEFTRAGAIPEDEEYIGNSADGKAIALSVGVAMAGVICALM